MQVPEQPFQHMIVYERFIFPDEQVFICYLNLYWKEEQNTQ